MSAASCLQTVTYDRDPATNICKMGGNVQLVNSGKGCGVPAPGAYTSDVECANMVKMVSENEKLKADLQSCKAGSTSEEDSQCQSDKDTAVALAITFGVLFVVAIILVGVLVPMAKKGKL